MSDPRESSEPPSDPRARVERVFEVWNEHGPQAMAEQFWAETILWEEPRLFPEGGIHRGRDACMERMRERFTLVGEVRIEVTDAQLIGELLLIDVIVRGQGPASGVPTAMREHFLIRTEEGQTVHFREFLDREEALAAAAAGD